MPLTQAMLEAWQIEPSSAERILQAHTEALQQLTQERDELAQQLLTMQDAITQRNQALQDADTSRAALERLQAQQQRQARQQSMREALLSSGANPQAVDLLLLAMTPDGAVLHGDSMTPEDMLCAVRAQYPAFFSEPIYLPTDPVSPPISAAAPLTREDLRRMSQEEINRNWSAVRSALEKGSM